MIVFVGDIHGEFGKLNSFMSEIYSKHKEPITFIICGDVAYFWENEPTPIVKRPPYSKVIWIPGNHENWEMIDKYELGKLHELQDGVFMASFGAIEEIEGHKILFCGGADSIDKNLRTPFVDWFPQEIITNKDMNFLFDKIPDQKVDILVSHTCPSKVFSELSKKIDRLEEKSKDPSTYALDIIVDKFRPDLNVFGHFHKFMEGRFDNLYWVCLSYIYSNSIYYKTMKT
ncbi:MAG: metallophosphoesterase [Bacilli bacterium]|nr:metallophosphoesterase [Bacilli bacterium]